MKNRCRLDVIVSEFVSVDCYMIRPSVLMNSNGWSRAAKPCRSRPDIVLPWSYFLTWKTLIATFITPSANKWCKNLILSLFRVEVAISKIVLCKIRQKNCYSIYHTNFAYSYSPYNINELYLWTSCNLYEILFRHCNYFCGYTLWRNAEICCEQNIVVAAQTVLWM